MRRVLLIIAASSLFACHRPPKLADTCVADSDCVITTLGADCCYGCEAAAGNATSVEARAAWCATNRPNAAAACPRLKCADPSIRAFCIDNRCAVRAF